MVKTYSDSYFTIEQKNSQMPVAKLHNFLHPHNRMIFYPYVRYCIVLLNR